MVSSQDSDTDADTIYSDAYCFVHSPADLYTYTDALSTADL